ncbi:BrnA antitoxin family protein [Mesorhizobium sp.]|uniref:BrnA antitoxin family protein n=1 Tax=Mesorhizobium sp. TaxID=1871066 RepID=UPI0025DA563B|nr:BrnA antitoxin family protein [Mesorhizobium sp.]
MPDETIDDDEELSFAPAPSPDQSPEEARARLAALRGKPLDAPSRLAVVSEEEPVDATVNREPEAAAAAPSGATINLALPANMAARLLALLGDEKPVEAPKAEPQRPAKAQKGEKPLFKPVKVRITTRVDADVLEAFKATGPGWQSRMNSVLRANMPST